MKKLEQGMLLRAKNVMDDAMPMLDEIRELIPESLYGCFRKLLWQFEDLLCSADVSDEYQEIAATPAPPRESPPASLLSDRCEAIARGAANCAELTRNNILDLIADLAIVCADVARKVEA